MSILAYSEARRLFPANTWRGKHKEANLQPPDFRTPVRHSPDWQKDSLSDASYLIFETTEAPQPNLCPIIGFVDVMK